MRRSDSQVAFALDTQADLDLTGADALALALLMHSKVAEVTLDKTQ